MDMQDSKSGKTALHCAVEKGDLTITRYLLTQVGGSHGNYILPTGCVYGAFTPGYAYTCRLKLTQMLVTSLEAHLFM